jgi:CheY-like chemotaxis protein
MNVVEDVLDVTRMPHGKLHRWRVLIIEDNIDAADSLGELLQLRGYETAVAYDGPEGISKARQFLPDAVFCDVGLPGMNGYDVARTLRSDAALDGTCLVALSGYTLPEDLRRAAEAGFAHYLAKPPSIEKIHQLLEDLFSEEKRARRRESDLPLERASIVRGTRGLPD